ncbi:hypothetical protein SLA2020_105000 [Shorea laevis]
MYPQTPISLMIRSPQNSRLSPLASHWRTEFQLAHPTSNTTTPEPTHNENQRRRLRLRLLFSLGLKALVPLASVTASPTFPIVSFSLKMLVCWSLLRAMD